MGLEFQSFPPNQKAELQEWLARKLGNRHFPLTLQRWFGIFDSCDGGDLRSQPKVSFFQLSIL